MKKLFAWLLILALCLSVLPAALAAPAATPEEGRVLLLTNRERLKADLPPLTMVDFLQEIGEIRSRELMEAFSHSRPDGSECWTVLEDVNHTNYANLGENIAAGYDTPEEVMQAWMNSQGHRKNILNPNFAHIGVGDTVGYSTDLGWECHNWVQFFYRDFDCAYRDLTLLLPEEIPAGVSVDDMGIWAELTCAACGTAYLPLMEEFCTGYDPADPAAQTVTVSLFDHTATFTVPAQTTAPEPTVEFTDVQENHWFYDAVQWAVEQKVTNGYEDGTFRPNAECIRREVVTFLWNAEGKPEIPADAENPFQDVKNGQWYTTPILWAVREGITNGMNPEGTLFAPKSDIMRREFVTFLWRLAGKPEPTVTLEETPFTDVKDGQWYTAPILWAYENGITNGKGAANTFAPKDTCTRAEIVTFLSRFYQ